MKRNPTPWSVCVRESFTDVKIHDANAQHVCTVNAGYREENAEIAWRIVNAVNAVKGEEKEATDEGR